MKYQIKGVQIRLKVGSVPKAPAGKVDEKTVRDAYAHALAAAHLSGVRSLILFPAGCRDRRFPSTASAKIMAQEIFRYIRQRKGTKKGLKNILIVLPSVKEYKIFKKTVFGYLDHIVDTLCWGPFVTVDTIIEVSGGIVLIKRSNPPFGWALPGGFLEYGESLEEAAAREAEEETGLLVRDLRQWHTYSEPGRDPRFHTVTTVFIAKASGTPKAASDAALAKVFAPEAWKKLDLAFDHRKVLEDYLQDRKQRR